MLMETEIELTGRAYRAVAHIEEVSQEGEFNVELRAVFEMRDEDEKRLPLHLLDVTLAHALEDAFQSAYVARDVEADTLRGQALELGELLVTYIEVAAASGTCLDEVREHLRGVRNLVLSLKRRAKADEVTL